MAKATRDIGPLGTAARVLVGLALLYIAGGASIASWEIEPQDPVIGLIALPALTVALGLVAGRYAQGPIRFTGPLGIAINLAVIVALIANGYARRRSDDLLRDDAADRGFARAGWLRGYGRLELDPRARRPDRLRPSRRSTR